MIEVYRDVEFVIREAILHIECNNNAPLNVDHYTTVCAHTFNTEFVSNSVYDDITIDLQLFPNLKNYLKIDRVAVKISKKDSSDFCHAFIGSIFIGSMFMANNNTKVKDVTISRINNDGIQSMKKDTCSIFLTMRSHYTNDRIN